ncbi:MAG: hypothetical protein WC889_08585 [Myxococcota bacterium]
MKNAVKVAVLVTLVFGVMGLGVYFVGCATTNSNDGGITDACAGKASMDDCTNGTVAGKCITSATTGLTCVAKCADAWAACAPGGACHYFMDDTVSKGAWVCLSMGTKTIGTACEFTDDCVAAAECVSTKDGEALTCYGVCDTGHLCAPGGTCTSLVPDLPFSVCEALTSF